ncbi:MAG: chromate transporter, partial [Eubacteriales bacterium]|nr:chromate transporter [Eubacteriales bacterium]
LVLLASHFLVKFKESRALSGILEGIRPAALGLLASAVIFLAQESIFTGFHLNLLPMLFFIIVVFVNGKYRISPITLTILAGFVGAFIIR